MAFRALTDGEIALARPIFGEAIDYGRVRIANHKWWPFQPANFVMAPSGAIHFHPRSNHWRADFCVPDAAQGLLIHEMTHVWQSQRRGRFYLPLMRHPFCRYRYSVVAGRRLEDYGIEQQAEILHHLFLARNGRAVAGMPSLIQLESILASARDPILARQARL